MFATTIKSPFTPCLAALLSAVGCTIVPAPSDESGDSSNAEETTADVETSTDGKPRPSDDNDATTGGRTNETASESDPGNPTTDARDSSDTQNGEGDTSGASTSEPTSEGETTPSADKPAFSCAGADLENAVTLSGRVQGDQTWSGTIVVEGAVSVDGATITIEPGTHFIMKADSTVEFGWNGTGGTVKAGGTPDDPITFCGEEPEPGFWGYVTLRAGITSNSTWSNVLVNGAGLGLHSAVLVENLVIENSGDSGLVVDDFKAGSDGVFVSGCKGKAVILGAPGAATRFPAQADLRGNAEDVAEIAFSRIGEETVFHDLGIPYLASAGLSVRDGAAVTLDGGVEMRFAADTGFEVGWNSTAATLTVDGTEDKPVLLRGESEEPGFWQGLWINGSVKTSSEISHLTVKHAGGTGNVDSFSVFVPIEVSHLTLQDNTSPAYISGSGLKPESTHWKITGATANPLNISAKALYTLPTNSDYSGNGQDEIFVLDAVLEADGTIVPQNVPYVLKAGLCTRGAEVTIQPGVTFSMPADTLAEFGWNANGGTLSALGTEEQPIVFKGVEATAGYWSGIRIDASMSSDSKIDWLNVLDAGGAALDGALRLDRPVPVTHSTFSNSDGYGILVRSSDTSDYATTNTFEDNALDDVGTF